MAKKEGYSREGLFGDIIHYDSKGHKIGESRPSLFGGYTNYDAKGHKIGESRPGFFGGYTNYDAKGHKIGSVEPGLFGSQVHYDAKGHRIGTSDPTFFGDQTHSGDFGGHAGLINNAGAAAGIRRDDRTIMTAIGIAAAGSAMASAEEYDDPDTEDSSADWIAPPSSATNSVSPSAPSIGMTVRYIIACSAAKGENVYYRTHEANLRVGGKARDAGTDEIVEVLAIVDCLEDALPPEARTTKWAVCV